LHLHSVDVAQPQTRSHRRTAPQEVQYKLRVIFDAVDCEFFERRPLAKPIEFHGRNLGPNTSVVTYVSRGLESARGFDIFMKAAKMIYQAIPDVVFLIAGSE